MSDVIRHRSRRRLLVAASAAIPAALATSLAGRAAAATALVATMDAAVMPGRTLRFPDDEGSHPDFRIEWWYVTGRLRDRSNVDLGFQITFFRHRNASADANPSRFAPRQMIAVHAALSDPRRGHLMHLQRLGRAAFDRAIAAEGHIDVRLAGCSLIADGSGRLAARIDDRALTLDLALSRTQPPLLHGDNGYSRKGPSAGSASWYYTLPHLAVTGTVGAGRDAVRVEGSAWLDHEWSSAPLEADAAGWDWIGINLDDGGALMAFRMRDRNGGALWGSATLRDRDGRVRAFAPSEVRWTPTKQWHSPRTGASYPVGCRVEVGDFAVDIDPMMDDQEQDARITTGTVYWEGAVTARAGGKPIGRGYLEMTGYAGTFRL